MNDGMSTPDLVIGILAVLGIVVLIIVFVVVARQVFSKK